MAFDTIYQGSGGLQCVDTLNQPYSLDVTIEISKVTLPLVGVDADPVGGILLTITQ